MMIWPAKIECQFNVRQVSVCTPSWILGARIVRVQHTFAFWCVRFPSRAVFLLHLFEIRLKTLILTHKIAIFSNTATTDVIHFLKIHVCNGNWVSANNFREKEQTPRIWFTPVLGQSAFRIFLFIVEIVAIWFVYYFLFTLCRCHEAHVTSMRF